LGAGPRKGAIISNSTSFTPVFQPIQYLVRIFVRRKYRVKNLGKLAIFNDPRHAFKQPKATILECGKLESLNQLELCVAENFDMYRRLPAQGATLASLLNLTAC